MVSGGYSVHAQARRRIHTSGRGEMELPDRSFRSVGEVLRQVKNRDAAGVQRICQGGMEARLMRNDDIYLHSARLALEKVYGYRPVAACQPGYRKRAHIQAVCQLRS